MNKVINGKMYDTDMATRVCTIPLQENEKNSGKTGTLYRKTTGEWFARWSQSGLDDRIIPLHRAHGQRIAENKLTGNEYEALFGNVEE